MYSFGSFGTQLAMASASEAYSKTYPALISTEPALGESRDEAGLRVFDFSMVELEELDSFVT